jgi:hypothetical protein
MMQSHFEMPKSIRTQSQARNQTQRCRSVEAFEEVCIAQSTQTCLVGLTKHPGGNLLVAAPSQLLQDKESR